MELTWAPSQKPALPPPLSDPLAQDPSQNASIFAAIQEQLGLKLDNQRGPVDVVVIDSIQQPTEN
jgi:uncharacterized protein (TIGR03435 family)